MRKSRRPTGYGKAMDSPPTGLAKQIRGDNSEEGSNPRAKAQGLGADAALDPPMDKRVVTSRSRPAWGKR